MKTSGLLGFLRQQQGTSTLEFAIVLPTLLIIFLGGLELSRAWLTVNVTTNAVREGARVGRRPTPCSQARIRLATRSTIPWLWHASIRS